MKSDVPSGTPGSKPKKKRPRANGEGTIVERANGTWMYSIRLGKDRVTGRPQRLVLYARTKPELLQKIQDERARTGGVLKARQSGTVAVFIEQWLESEVKPNRRPNTYANYHGLLTKHAIPLLHVPLDRFDGDSVEKLYRDMRARGVRPSVLHRCSLALRTAFQARRRRTGLANPFDLAAKPRHTNAETPILSRDQVLKLLASAKKRNDRYEALLAVLALAGLRLGEALGLQWSDVEFDQGWITVRRQVTEIAGKCDVAEPKTKRSRRTIPVSKIVLDALKRRQEIAEREKHGSPFVFVTIAGKHPSRSNLRRDVLAPAIEDAELPAVTFHGLRGAAATALAQEGIDLATIGGILGQSKPSVTLERYVHASADSQKRAVERLDTVLLGRKPRPAA